MGEQMLVGAVDVVQEQPRVGPRRAEGGDERLGGPRRSDRAELDQRRAHPRQYAEAQRIVSTRRTTVTLPARSRTVTPMVTRPARR